MTMRYYKKYRVLFLTFLCYFLGGCQSKPYQTVEIDLFSKKVPLNIEIDRILPLETTAHSLIGDIAKVRYYDGKFYVLDRFVSRNLFLFDKDGKYITHLPKGRGPGEVLRPIEFIIDSSTESVFTWDPDTHILSEYDLNLNFKSTEIIENLYITHAEDIGNGLWLINNPAPRSENEIELGYFLYSIYDFGQKKYLSSFLPINRDLVNLSSTMPISVFQNRVLFSVPFSNFLYSLDDQDGGKYREEFLFDFGSLTLNQNDVVKGINYVYEEAREGRKIIPFYGIGEIKEYISFNFSVYGRDNFLLYSKKTREAFSSEIIFQEKMLPRCRLSGSIGNNQFLAVADPEDVLRFFSEQDEIPDILSGLQSHSNPCLIVFSLREK